MALGNYQKLTRITGGQPFGDGKDGAYSSATIPSMTYESCSGTTGTKSLTTVNSSLSNGDMLLLIQMRGTGVGQWEVNYVVSGGGTNAITLLLNMQYTYTDGGASQAQAVVIPRYTNVTVQAGTWNTTTWAGNTGGVLAFACNGLLTITGNISGNDDGFVRGSQPPDGTITGNQGEGTAGAGETNSTAANGSGGGGGQGGVTGAVASAGGGGGGNAVNGNNGSFTADRTPGTGGSSSGNADLTNLTLGGAGGSGGSMNIGGGLGGAGGDGGGGIFIFANNITTPTGVIAVNGANGSDGTLQAASGGGGAGGSILVQCNTAALGTNKFTATKGAKGTHATDGGDGSVGRIAVHHSGTISGSTNDPSFDDTEDLTLTPQTGVPMII
jgi:hypothetical protein